MSQSQLASLLSVDPDKFSAYIEQLEHAALRPGVDIRLHSEILTRTRNVVSQLGLEPSQATPEAIFAALQQQLMTDEQNIIQRLGLQQGEMEDTVARIATRITLLSTRESSLSITPSGIKKLLKTVPPKKTLKLLKLRSLDSVLKRHDPRALYILASIVENQSWKSQVHAKIRRIDSKDITWQPVVAVVLPDEWYARVASHVSSAGAVIVQQELGTVLILPVVDVSRAGSTMLILGLALQAVSSISTKSLPYRTQALSEGYNSVLPKIANGEHPVLSSVFGIEPSWRIVHELIGAERVSFSDHAVEFEDFNLFWESTEAKIASIAQSASFWVGSHYLGIRTAGKPLSLHVLDVASSLARQASFAERSSMYLERSLWNELQMNYLSQEVISRSLVHQLSKFSGTVVV